MFNYDSNEIGLGGFFTSDVPSKFPVWAIIVISVVGFLIIVAGVFCFVRHRKNKLKAAGIESTYGRLDNTA